MSHVDLRNFICGYALHLEPGVKHGVWIPEPVEDDESDEGEDEPDDAEDQSGDGEDGSGDSEEESDGDEGGYLSHSKMAARLSGNGQFRFWKRQGAIGCTVLAS
jgi:hypothetical protein